MNLKSVCAKLSTNGLPAIQLVHMGSQEIIQSLRLVKASSTHRNFIIGTWLKSYRPTARKLGIGAFYDKHEPEIAESRWQDCTVATDDDEYTVYAWVCGDVSALLHLYVVPELRHIGVATGLQEHVCGTRRPDLARPWSVYRGQLQVNPYLLARKELK